MDDSDAAVHFSQRGAYRKCVFCNINSLDIEPGVVVHFFKFPDVNSPRRQIWAAALLELNPAWISYYSSKETNKVLRLCSLHFLPTEYKHQLGIVLRAVLDLEALPSVLGPAVYEENSDKRYNIGPEYSCSCASFQKSLRKAPQGLKEGRKESKALLSEMELAWQIGSEEEQPDVETTIVEEAVSHIILPVYNAESDLMVPMELDTFILPDSVSPPKKTATKRKTAVHPCSVPKKKAVSTPPLVNANQISPQKPKTTLTVHGTLVPSKPAATVRPNNSAASKVVEVPAKLVTKIATTPRLTTPTPVSNKANVSSAINPVASVKPKCTPKKPKSTPKKPLCTLEMYKHSPEKPSPVPTQGAKPKAKDTTPAAISKPPPEPASKIPEKAKSAMFKIFLTENGKTCYLSLDTKNRDLTPEQMKTAEIIAFQTAQRLGCEVTEPPQMILIKSNDSNAIDKRLIPELENTKVFNVMFKLEERSAQNDSNQLKIMDRPWNPSSDSSPDETNSQSTNSNSTTTELDPLSLDDPKESNTSSEGLQSPEDSETSLSDSTFEKDVEFVEMVDTTVPIVISDDSDSESGTDEQASPCHKYTSNTSNSSGTDITSDCATSDMSKCSSPEQAAQCATIAPPPEKPEPVTQQNTQTFSPMSSSTPMRPVASTSQSPNTVLSSKIVGHPKPILKLYKPSMAKGSTIPSTSSSTTPMKPVASTTQSSTTKLSKKIVGHPKPTLKPYKPSMAKGSTIPSTSSSTPMKSVASTTQSSTTELSNTILSHPKPIIKLYKSAEGSSIPPNYSPSFITKMNAAGQNETYLVLQPGKNVLETTVGAVQLHNGQRGLISLPSSIIKSLAMTSVKAGKVPPLVHIVNPPVPGLVTVSAPVTSQPPAAKVVTVAAPATSSLSTTTVTTAAPAATATVVTPAPIIACNKKTKLDPIRSALTLPANMTFGEFHTNIADFVLEPWAKAMKTKFVNSKPECMVSLFTTHAMRETIKLCEKLGMDKKSSKLTNLQNKTEEISLEMRTKTKIINYHMQQIEKLQKEVNTLKIDKESLKRKAKSENRKAKRLSLAREVLKKKLEEATDAQAMVRKELCDQMTPVALQMHQRMYDNSKNPGVNSRQYTPDVKEFALRIHRTSRTAYKYVQKVFPESLPTVTTLRIWMRESLDNKDPLTSAIESVAAGAASAQNLLNILQESPEVEVSAGEQIEEPEEEAMLDEEGEILEEEEEIPEEEEATLEQDEEIGDGGEEITEVGEAIPEAEKDVYYYEGNEEVSAGDQISLEESGLSDEMMSPTMPVLQVVDQSDRAKVQVVYASPQGPANYSLSEDGMSILINVSQDQDYYKNQ